jgi:hypothetical protein
MADDEKHQQEKGVEELAEQEASQTPVDELDTDIDDEASPPGRAPMPGSGNEPKPNKSLGISDFPVREWPDREI